MEAIIEEIGFKIVLIEKDIDKIKAAIQKYKSKEEIATITQNVESDETKKLSKRFNSSLNKTKKPNISFLDLYENKITSDDDALSDTSNVTNTSEMSTKSNLFFQTI
jgi:hypothetical protein